MLVIDQGIQNRADNNPGADVASKSLGGLYRPNSPSTCACDRVGLQTGLHSLAVNASGWSVGRGPSVAV